MPLGFEGQKHKPDPAAPHGVEAVRAATSDRDYRRILIPSVVIILVFVAAVLISPETAESVLDTMQDTVVGGLSWFYVLLVAGFVGFAIWMGLGRYGDIRLGADDEPAEFSRGAWFAMLFTAGMGVGLVFWGVAEPLSHFVEPRPGVTGTPEELAQASLAQTYLHWGIHAWAVYSVVGLGLAYAIHRKGRPVSIRWVLEPLLGDRVLGWVGDVIDVAAVVGGAFGVATSIGLGVLQIGAGAQRVGIADATLAVQLVVVAIITVIAIGSLLSGLAKGIKWLSNINITIAGVLLLFVLFTAPTLFLVRQFIESIGQYLDNVIEMTFYTSAFSGDEGQDWQGVWTTFFWGSWISWAPLVGIFIARISRGRTVREFVAGVLGVTALVSFLWMAVFGGAGIYYELFGQGGLVSNGTVIAEDALFGLLETLPLADLTSIIATVLVAAFLVTSINSGSFTLAMMAHGGDPDPPSWVRVMWAIAGGLVGAAMLISGGLAPLQTVNILMAAPFSVIMILIVVATVKAFHEEYEIVLRGQQRAARREVSEQISEEVGRAVADRSVLLGEPPEHRAPLPPVGRFK